MTPASDNGDTGHFGLAVLPPDPYQDMKLPSTPQSLPGGGSLDQFAPPDSPTPPNQSSPPKDPNNAPKSPGDSKKDQPPSMTPPYGAAGGDFGADGLPPSYQSSMSDSESAGPEPEPVITAKSHPWRFPSPELCAF